MQKRIQVGVCFSNRLFPHQDCISREAYLILSQCFCESSARSLQSGSASGGNYPLCLQPIGVLYSLTSQHSACNNSLNILDEFLLHVSRSIYPRSSSSCFPFILGVHFFFRFQISLLPCNLSQMMASSIVDFPAFYCCILSVRIYGT